MNEVEQFCDRALLLNEGHMAYLGQAIEAVKRYYFLQQKTDTAAQPVPPGSQKETPAPVTPAFEQDFYWPEPDAFIDISTLHQTSNRLARCTAVALCDQNGHSCFAFQQGQTASFFFEFEIFCDIEVPVGGAEIVNEKGIIVHGKNSLLYESEAPTFVQKGSWIRFRQDIKLEIATGEYTFNIGLASIDRDTYIRRASLAHPELASRMTILNIIPSAGTFAVVYRTQDQTVQLLHFGVANLPGQCQVKVIQPSG
jgi:lipopolysaccharide transport system ATP-binding protein